MSQTVIVYLNLIPAPTGSGAHLRLYSNVQAYADLGFRVVVALVGNDPLPATYNVAGLPGLICRSYCLPIEPASLLSRLQLRLGWTGLAARRFLYPLSVPTWKAYGELSREFPGAIHHFEGDPIAAIALQLPPGSASVFGHHDLFAEANLAMARIQAEVLGQPIGNSALRENRFHSRAEQRISRRCRLVLNISDHDRQVMRQQWGLDNNELLPMSVAATDSLPHRSHLHGGLLRLLHLGRIEHLPNFRSLEYLFTTLMPALTPDLQSKIQIRIVGSYTEGDFRFERIRALAQPYAGSVEFVGFVSDIEEEFAQASAQLVVATDASGLRTRMIESFANGIPVIATPLAARGIAGLDRRPCYFPVESPAGFATLLEDLLRAPARLEVMAAQARKTYDEFHSRTVVAATLGRLLRQYGLWNGSGG